MQQVFARSARFIVMGDVKALSLANHHVHWHADSLMIQRVALLKFLLLVKTSCEFKSSTALQICN
jgi:hypothetical protein